MGTMEYGFQREQEMIQKVSQRAFQDGRDYEKERLIKLLENLDPFGSIDTAFVPELVALIKGETQ